MLLESEALKCTGRAVLLAALLEETQIRWQPEHAEFFAPEGDHFSLLSLWSSYEKVEHKPAARKAWCRDRRLCAAEFALVPKTVKRLRTELHKHNRLSHGEGADEDLMRAFVRGYFLFFAVHHDQRFLRAGYQTAKCLA